MNMYNNLPQQTPQYPYNYGAYQYQRYAGHTPEAQQVTAMPPQVNYQLPTVTQQPSYLKGRPVVSVDEARASQIDLDGSLYIFPDIGNKKIYTKQINLDGTAAFNTFSLVETAEKPVPEEPVVTYVTKEELNLILDEFRRSLEQPEAPKGKPAAPQTFNL